MPNPSFNHAPFGRSQEDTIAPSVSSTMGIMLKVCIFAIPCLWAAGVFSAELVHLMVKSQPAENGKVLNMEFRETERTAGASIVNVTFISGGSVSSSMFALRGECAVARARGKHYFKSQKLSSPPNAHRMTFPVTATGDMQARLKSGTWAISDCENLGF